VSVNEEVLPPFVDDIAPADGPRNFTETLKDMLPRLHAYFGRRMANGSDVDDCAIETVAVLWKTWDSAPHSSPAFETWLFGIARGVMSNYRRGTLRRQTLLRRLAEEQLVRPQADPDHAQDGAVHAALATLRSLDRELVMLIVWDGFSVQDAGAVVGLTGAAARTRYSRARKRLRAALASS
jgi:RNA polymerase sigma-70 factor (ECF subfamily)